MYRSKRFAGVVFGATILASLMLGGSALAQGAESQNVQLTPSRDSGVSGTATLADVEGGVKVQLSMKGLPEAGVKHINHIHGGGTCADDRAGRTAPVTIPLNAVVAREDGTGSATTTIEGVTRGRVVRSKIRSASYSCTPRPKKDRVSLRASPAPIWFQDPATVPSTSCPRAAGSHHRRCSLSERRWPGELRLGRWYCCDASPDTSSP